jgi:hypothetical protein
VTLASNGTSLIAGVPNLLILSSKVVGVALDGALLHARNAAGIPVGTYSDAGGVFVPFPGCGKNAQGQDNGVVHSMLISCIVCPSTPISLPLDQSNTRIQETYSNLSYIPPKCGNEPVILGGLVVTDNGFGIWNYTFPVTGGATPDSDGDCDGTKSKKSTSIKLSKGNIW